MKTTVISINEESFEETLRAELLNAQDFEWTGWRIPIYLDTETGECSSGSWLSQSGYQPNAHELPIKIERWSMSDRHSDFWSNEEDKEVYDESDLEYEIDEMIEWYKNEMDEYEDIQFEDIVTYKFI